MRQQLVRAGKAKQGLDRGTAIANRAILKISTTNMLCFDKSSKINQYATPI
jgi:hypothetical protein